MKKILEKLKLKSKQAQGDPPLYEVSVNLKNFGFWDQICPKNMNEKNFERKKIRFQRSIW